MKKRNVCGRRRVLLQGRYDGVTTVFFLHLDVRAVVVIRVASCASYATVGPVRRLDSDESKATHARRSSNSPSHAVSRGTASDRSVLRTTPGARHFGTLLRSWRRQRWELRRLGATVRCFIMTISHARQAHSCRSSVCSVLSAVLYVFVTQERKAVEILDSIPW